MPQLLVTDEEIHTMSNELPTIEDDRLRLIFTCCHPALSLEAQVALTLRLVCGLDTYEVARAFLVQESTMAARITRAKKKIVQSRIPYEIPGREHLAQRVSSVLDVVYLLFTTGHTAPEGNDLVRHDLVRRSLDLARMLRTLLPGDASVTGLLALILLSDARSTSRVNASGQLVLLSDQDRALWDRQALEEGQALTRESLAQPPFSRFALMAGIAAVHAASPSWQETNWTEIVAFYDQLMHTWPTPIVALNRAVAIGLEQGPTEGLRLLDELRGDPTLADYSYFSSARADFLRRVNRLDEAREAYHEALERTKNETEKTFLRGRINEIAALPT
jgi:RNA polymerase sigma-70 factor (ECF subfamily)